MKGKNHAKKLEKDNTLRVAAGTCSGSHMVSQ
jgi:hypothetical protein